MSHWTIYLRRAFGPIGPDQYMIVRLLPVAVITAEDALDALQRAKDMGYTAPIVGPRSGGNV